jgi:2',3'-cyclic-nucleotide 2'-phosphodiesterase (5'-nucleotidase family)
MQKFSIAILLFFIAFISACQPQNPAANQANDSTSLLVFNMADMHSGYDAYPILLSNIDQRMAQQAQAISVFVLNGDFFEAGSVVAQKSKGKLDMAFLAELKKRGEVVFNIGNHDFDIVPMNDFIHLASTLGVRVIGTFASSELNIALPAFTDIPVGQQHIRFIGVNTDHKRTFPTAMRDSLTIPAPQDWLAQHYTKLAQDADYTVLLSHAGLMADKAMLAFLATQNSKPLYVLGAHDHLSLQTEFNGMPYLHTTFKGQRLVVVNLQTGEAEPQLNIENLITDFSQAGEQAFTKEIAATRAEVLSPEDLTVVGMVPKDMTLTEAVDWTLQVMRDKTGADVALFNHSSFGSGLQQGPLALYRFNQFMRFENKLMVSTVDGLTLKAILQHANQHQQTDITQLSGDFVYANVIDVQNGQSYKIVTPDWVTLPDNQVNYLGMSLDFTEVKGVSVKTLLTEALSKQPSL